MNQENNETNSFTGVNNAGKYIVLSDGRMARLLKPVKVKHYLYYTYKTNDKKTVRINANNIHNINNEIVESK